MAQTGGAQATIGVALTAVLSATVAGLIIGTFCIAVPAFAKWGGVLGWAGLHAVGGVIGGVRRHSFGYSNSC
jgi:hypothetical protein